MYRQYLLDPDFLARHHGHRAAAIALACGGLAVVLTPRFQEVALFVPAIFLLASVQFPVVVIGFLYSLAAAAYLDELHWSLAWLLPAAGIWTLFASSVLHNASHGNIRPRWLQTVLGEMMALAQLVGFADWVIVHIMHHSHSDDPEKDPHPPQGLGYWAFLRGMRDKILKVLLADYLDRWGRTNASMSRLKRMAMAGRANQLAKVTFWWLLLGPEYFSAFFAASIVMKMMHYAWFNYATHQLINGEVAILNLDRSLYRFVNSVSFGLYYHKNHHANPKLFDPRKMQSEPAKGKTDERPDGPLTQNETEKAA
ncbi:MAG: fatty acid desaturase [Bdellovibrionaceae bacterium]|nr:fatty acid desaturase [Pseudobdellovibrionaceae bacterium]